MASTLDEKSLAEAFKDRNDIQGAIRIAASSPPYIELFNTISTHIISLIPSSSSSEEPASKKRRLDDEDIAVRSAIKANGRPKEKETRSAKVTEADASEQVQLEIKDISMVIPQRKKFTLCFNESHLYAKLADGKDVVPGTSFAWSDIEQVFCLPIPEKTQKQYNYILFPRGSQHPPSKPTPGTSAPPDPLVFTISDTVSKPNSISGTQASQASAVSDSYKTLFDWAISTHVAKGVKITQADPKLFASEVRQSHRPTEKAVFVKGFRGSKDGYLFFLPNGILWGFKKPLVFLQHASIQSVAYTSVLQRTFNLSIEVARDEETTEELEFSMLDQEDYGGIDAYIKRYGLADKSMAEQRKAKLAGVNVVKDEDGNVIGHVQAGELEKAEREAGGAAGGGGMLDELGDEDDSDEGEDYDPGSEGESEGSGSSDEESGDEGGGGGGEDDDEEGDDDDDEDEL